MNGCEMRAVLTGFSSGVDLCLTVLTKGSFVAMGLLELLSKQRWAYHIEKNILKGQNGLLEDSSSDVEAECCDVRWDSKSDNSSKGTLKRTHPSCQHGTSLSSSANSRLCNSRLKLCLLVLVLLHTVATITASHNLSTMSSLEENSTNEEFPVE
ncbi:transmembrane protein [Clarias magur]|uniref:Transmembrane protein n=1 Tax=Clarias magur TaxID=1594786 RepID=A0A8J4TU71_CLAMG|nr:transmembrane protein [Clarias magur]